MLFVEFKNVGQGDSIIIEWHTNSLKKIGIIDCNIINGKNPVLDHLKENQINEIEFIVLTHFHYDHFSGFADVFEYCMLKNIKTKLFFHTIYPFVLQIYNRIFTSQKLQKGVERFFKTYELFDSFINEKVHISCHLKAFNLSKEISLQFLAPESRTYEIMSRQLSRKVNKISTSYLDINRLSSIIYIENQDESILLTSDSNKNVFRKIQKFITKKVSLAQVPHHGSISNIYHIFWKSVEKRENCPAIFSVGYEPKDKLPNIETVEFFDTNDYDVYSTNSVYGISEYYQKETNILFEPKFTNLNYFSSLRKRVAIHENSNNKFTGNQRFKVFE